MRLGADIHREDETGEGDRQWGMGRLFENINLDFSAPFKELIVE